MRLAAVPIGLALVLVFVWERVDVVRVGYQVERLKAQKVMLERERDELQVKLSALTSPERIAKVATEKLGMVPPERGQIVLVHGEAEAPARMVPENTEFKLAQNMTWLRRHE